MQVHPIETLGEPEEREMVQEVLNELAAQIDLEDVLTRRITPKGILIVQLDSYSKPQLFELSAAASDHWRRISKRSTVFQNVVTG
jgi:hypothetical protein